MPATRPHTICSDATYLHNTTIDNKTESNASCVVDGGTPLARRRLYAYGKGTLHSDVLNSFLSRAYFSSNLYNLLLREIDELHLNVCEVRPHQPDAMFLNTTSAIQWYN